MQYVEQTTLIDSDRESNKSDDDVMKEQQMYIWNKNYGVRPNYPLSLVRSPSTCTGFKST